MLRFRELIADVRKQYPNDHFFSDFEEKIKLNPLIRRYFRAYNNAFMELDDESWNILKAKALQHYLNHRDGQRKQGFFNQLNEAFAYRYLVKQGFKAVRFIKEGRKRKPDISFYFNQTPAYCEVKTLGISDAEIIKRKNINVVYDGSIYYRLSDGFFNKFCDAIIAGRKQINAVGTMGLVYVIITFDDFAGFHYATYRGQLIEQLRTRKFDNVFIKMGLLGRNRICKFKAN